jgi:hypothetical protein
MPTSWSQRSANLPGHVARSGVHERKAYAASAPPSAWVPPFELLESKLSPPRVRDETVSRGALISMMEERSASMPIVFLSAGPGWGKTTLLAQWAAGSGRPLRHVRRRRGLGRLGPAVLGPSRQYG